MGVDALPEAYRTCLADWDTQGFAILPGFYAEAELAPAVAMVERLWNDPRADVVVDDLVTHRRVRLRDVPAAARAHRRFKLNDLYLRHDPVRALALNPRINPVLDALLGHVPVLCNSLNFEHGSQQPDHVDSLYMTPRTPRHLVAIWVALEDCGADAGPLRYYPGSHRIPPFAFSDGGRHAIESEMPAWHRYMAGEVERLGLQPRQFAARRGDVFIWSADLLHGGSPILDPMRTRRSAVFHYFSEADCRALGARLVPQHGGYWIRRGQQPVPGTWQARVRGHLSRLRRHWQRVGRGGGRVG